MCSAIAASGVPALVMSKGHKIEGVSEVPLVGLSGSEEEEEVEVEEEEEQQQVEGRGKG